MYVETVDGSFKEQTIDIDSNHCCGRAYAAHCLRTYRASKKHVCTAQEARWDSTEDIAEETLTKDVSSLSVCSHNMTANNLTILCPFASVRCSLQSLPADRLMPASLTRSPSVNLENLVVLSISSHSVSSASLKKVCFRKSAVCYRISSWSWEFSHCKKSSASARKKLRSLYDVNCLAENYFQFGR